MQELSSNKHELSVSTSLQKFLQFFNRRNGFDLLVILICVASFCCSWIESIVNYDNLHWGSAYLSALDLKRGAIPHSQALVFYGFFQTWFQSIALTLFGERLMSVGIMTGLFYSLTLFLSYRVFLRFLPKHLSFIAVLFIFLVHPYIFYPAPNYFMYTFQLLALIFFLKYSQNRFNGFLAGFFISISLLSRYSSFIAILPPFIILLGWEFFTVQNTKKNIIEKIAIVCAGIGIPLIIFAAYLAMNSALGNFFYQMEITSKVWGKVGSVDTYLNFVASILQINESYASDLRGKLFTLILIICLFIICSKGIRKIFDKQLNSAYARYDVAAACLVTVFGYLNSLHVYETFRLVNGASLGVGIVVFVFYNIFSQTIKPVKYLIVIPAVLLGLYLSTTMFFSKTTSSYYPWGKDVLFHNGVTNKNIAIFKGKLLSKEYNDFYQEVFDSIAPYKKSCYIINYTSDVVAFLMNDLPRVQIAPIYFKWLDDVSKQAKLVDQNRAIILSYKALDLPDYQIIFNKKWPDAIPWMESNYLFIYAPKKCANDDRLSPENFEIRNH